MRIVLCCRVYSTHNRLGGMIHVIVERAEALARAGHEVFVITTRAPGLIASDVSGVSKVVNDVTVLHSVGVPQQYGDEYARFCDAECHRLKPDILHLDSWDKNRLWWHGWEERTRTAVSNHGEGVGSQLTAWRMSLHKRGPSDAGEAGSGNGIDVREWTDEHLALRHADVVIATCRFDRWLLSDLVGLGGKVKLVYNPLAPWHWAGRVPPPQDGARKFLCVGLWGHLERGFDVAEQACAEAGVELMRPNNVGRKDLVAYYDQCHALLLPGFQSKGFDLSVAESIARLRPVIYSDAGIATMEAIDQSWIVPTAIGSVAALVSKLRGPLPTVPSNAADKFHPDAHVKNWLEAITK